MRGRHLNNEMPMRKRGHLFLALDYLAPVEELEETGATESAKEEKQVHIKK